MYSALKGFVITVVILFVIGMLALAYNVGMKGNAATAQAYSRDFNGWWVQEYYPDAPGTKTMVLMDMDTKCKFYAGPGWRDGTFSDEGGALVDVCWKRVPHDQNPEHDVMLVGVIQRGSLQMLAEPMQTTSLPIKNFKPQP